MNHHLLQELIQELNQTEVWLDRFYDQFPDGSLNQEYQEHLERRANLEEQIRIIETPPRAGRRLTQR